MCVGFWDYRFIMEPMGVGSYFVNLLKALLSWEIIWFVYIFAGMGPVLEYFCVLVIKAFRQII